MHNEPFGNENNKGESMKIKTITSQHRRDFDAILEYEHSKKEQILEGGYDDTFYHQNVLPDIECESCGKKASKDYVAKETKYPDGMQI